MYGIMDFEGNWIVKPIPNQIYHILGNYYEINGNGYANDKLYYLNLKTKQLELQPFFMAFKKIYNKDYATISKVSNTNAIQGLINFKTQEVLLEAKYDYLDANKTFYWVKETQKSPYIIYRFSDQRKIMEGNFEDVNFYNDYFVVETNKKNIINKGTYYRQHNFYNDNGSQINSVNIVSIPSHHSFGKDNLLPIKDVNGDKYYIQKSRGKAPINVKDYQKIGLFSYGLAPVKHKKNNLYGYIDTKGKLVIPCIYRDANIFVGDTALVTTTKGNQVLINLKNKTVFVFPSYVYRYTNSPDKHYGKYTIRNGNGKHITYNHKGEKINKQYNN
ncbi:WG repeat-containing protein [Tenacibaculum sp.]|uniref:WG repeat-containing protein n=1 Tax=Tenacibaculum sp. TaxID=1906242 RepID=UPI003AA9A8DA